MVYHARLERGLNGSSIYEANLCSVLQCECKSVEGQKKCQLNNLTLTWLGWMFRHTYIYIHTAYVEMFKMGEFSVNMQLSKLGKNKCSSGNVIFSQY